ncbi:MAG: FAD-dependent oxidoreductase [Gemmatimonadaceae bacterium]
MTIRRREFLKVAGAQAGLLALGGCATATARSTGPLSNGMGAPALLPSSPDIAVIGAGALGGWTAYNLRKSGAKVLLIDAWGPGNSRSTSGDETRGVRTSYGDRPHGEQWMRWATQTIKKWKEWDDTVAREQDTRLFFTSGDLILRPAWEPYATTTLELFRKVGVRHAVLPMEEVRYRWPQIDVSAHTVALHEPDAGVVRARRACESVASEFRRLGGDTTIARATPTFRENGKLEGLQLDDGRRVQAGTYVFACGPWLGKVFPEVMGKRLKTPMGSVYYMGMPMGNHSFEWPNIPSWGTPATTGWPSLPIDNRGFRVRIGGLSATDPDLSQRTLDPASEERLRKFLDENFPLLKDAPIMQTHSCHYELTPSRNFIITPHPDMSNVWIVGGGNAEAFKFGPMIGDYSAKRILGHDDQPELAAGFALGKEFEDTPPTPPKAATPSERP